MLKWTGLKLYTYKINSEVEKYGSEGTNFKGNQPEQYLREIFDFIRFLETKVLEERMEIAIARKHQERLATTCGKRSLARFIKEGCGACALSIFGLINNKYTWVAFRRIDESIRFCVKKQHSFRLLPMKKIFNWKRL